MNDYTGWHDHNRYPEVTPMDKWMERFNEIRVALEHAHIGERMSLDYIEQALRALREAAIDSELLNTFTAYRTAALLQFKPLTPGAPTAELEATLKAQRAVVAALTRAFGDATKQPSFCAAATLRVEWLAGKVVLEAYVPPTCVIVEEEVYEPAREARTVLRRKLICDPPEVVA